MAITFFASRTLARNAAKELNNGKVKDMGSTAETGKRWAVEYTSKSDAVLAVAEASGMDVEVVKLAEVEPTDISGIPVSTDKVQELIKPVNVDMSNMYGKPTIMRTVKTKSPVEVRVKRNKGKLFNAALMEALSRVS